MPNYGTYAICPYYDTEERYSIICEGVIDDSSLHNRNYMRFDKVLVKDAWLKKYCETYEYARCPYYKIVDQKYEEGRKDIKLIVTPHVTASKAVKHSKNKDIEGQYTFNFKEDTRNAKNNISKISISYQDA